MPSPDVEVYESLARLQRLGYRVLRLEAALVMRALPVVLARVRAALAP